jgi:hypothetical protein
MLSISGLLTVCVRSASDALPLPLPFTEPLLDRHALPGISSTFQLAQTVIVFLFPRQMTRSRRKVLAWRLMAIDGGRPFTVFGP